MSEQDDAEVQRRLFPYFCERCDERVQLAQKIVGTLGDDAIHAGITLACGCTSEPMATNKHHRPDHWMLDFDKVLADAE